MPDESKKGNQGDDGFSVDVPDDLLEEAVSAVDRRVAEAKVNTGLGSETEISVDLDDAAEPTQSEEDAPDIEKMSVEELLNSGFLPDKIVAAFLEERTKHSEARKAAEVSKEKIAAFLAESESFRKRLTKEKDDAVKFASEKVLKEVLPVLDNLERALAHTGASTSTGAIREGVEITLRQFNHVLEKLGVTRVNTDVGGVFDPRVHEAVSQTENKDLPTNSIASVLQAGYLLHERLLRPAMVSVAKGGSAQLATPSGRPASASPSAASAEPSPAAPAAASTPPDEKPEERPESTRSAEEAALDARLAEEEAESKQASDESARTGTAEEPDAKGVDAGAGAKEAANSKELERRVAEAAGEERAEKRAAEQAEKQAQDQAEQREDVAPLDEDGEAEPVTSEPSPPEAREAAGGGTSNEPEPTAPPLTETPDEKLARIRRAGQAAREARRKKREETAAGGKTAASSANPLASPAFEDDDLESWETTVDSIRTDKSSGT